ncbi:glycosyltransferase [Nibricoccus sp. IMCC34717]|uniref:glycosyltransferase n=1 Tax=Nibricoccus sp. IMCC34717 TaxID=3034021 RepID=UPI00384C2DA4
MNILFVNYGDFTTNSLNHIGGFANGLCSRGHACVVAVTGNPESLRTVDRPLFIPAVQSALLENPHVFPDGRPADLVHVWSPRENVRRFTQSYLSICGGSPRVVIHLEDNEAYLTSHYTHKPIDALERMDAATARRLIPENLSHPTRHRDFLALADGVTHIIGRLAEHCPEGVPTQLLYPGVDFSLYHPKSADPTLRAELGLRSDEAVIVFTGSNTFANEPEMRELYVAIAELNRLGTRCRLVRTGFTTPQFLDSLSEELKRHVLDLGFIEKAKLPDLLALADILVQPGRPGPFNDFRLPSKLPEFLASGRAVLLPRTNLGLLLRDGEEAVLSLDSAPISLAAQLRDLLPKKAELARIGEAGARVARGLFDLNAQTEKLAAFYNRILAQPNHAPSAKLAARAQLSDADRLDDARVIAEAARKHQSERTHLELALRQHKELATTLEERLRLTGDHAKNLDAQLAAAKAELAAVELLRQHTHNLEVQLAAAKGELAAVELSKQHARNLEASLEQLRQSLMASETRLALANKRAADTELAAREKVGDLNAIIDRVKSELLQSQDKVRRMQASGSWQFTAPFRTLRRLFIDPLKSKRAEVVASKEVAQRPATAGEESPALSEPAQTKRTYSYTFNIDHPLSWNTTSNRLLFLGWCFENEGAPISGVRLRIGDTITEGSYGSKRLDVLASVGGKKQAEFCGVKVEAKLELGEFPVRVEVKHADGWYCYFETTLHVGKPGDPMELSEYQKWCAQHEKVDDADLKAIAAHVASFARRPVFSVIVPVFNPPVDLLRKALDSVLAQLYLHWELCIADDCSTDPEVRKTLEEFRGRDKRIRIVYREQNGHISRATNSALELATGDFVALFDHDDVLHPRALYEVAAALDAKPGLKFIYTDEDKIDGEDRRFDPYFKPDWNPDLLHGQNYTSHLSVFDRALISTLGGMRTGFEGSQDWDLTLRVVDAIEESEIHHIANVLYHWRAIPGSTALQVSEKSYPVDAAKRALTEHFARRQVATELVPVPGDHWRVRYPVPSPAPLVALIVPTRNAEKLVRQALTSIVEKTTYPNFEILLVDNGSDDPAALAYFASLPKTDGNKVRVLRYDGVFNYSAINNFAVRATKAEVIALVNNDIEVISPDWLTEMVSHALRPGIGAVGAMLYYPNDTVQHAGVILGLGGVAGHAFKEFPRNDQGQKNRLRLVQNYSAVTGACLVIRRDRFESVKGLDETHLAVAFNDVDLCCKLLKARYRNIWTPHAELYHHESATRGIEDTPEKKARFQSEVDYMMTTWESLLKNDPAYNPNLTLVGEDFSAAYLPRGVKTWAHLLAK